MNFCPDSLINSYQRSANGDPFHSQFQFDFTHRVSRSLRPDYHRNDRELALALTSLLAHWGMFRPSGKLRDKNELFFEALVKFAMMGKNPALRPIIGVPFEHLNTVPCDKIDSSLENIKYWFTIQGVSATDTLVSKTILGLLGNMPGYDRNFRRGLEILNGKGIYKGSRKFNGRGLHNLVEWASNHRWPRVRSQADSRLSLPRGRLVDMAIFQLGVEQPQ